MTKQFKLKIILILLLLAGITSLSAEIVLLKNGQTISGRVTDQNSGKIQLRTEKESIWIPKSDIIKIQYVAFTEEQKKQHLEQARMKKAEILAHRGRIEKEKLDRTTKELELKKIDEELQTEKLREAKEQSARAAALRELVAKGQMKKPKGEPISFWDFAWRSLLVPGWGHFTIDRPVMGTFYLVAVTSLLANTYSAGIAGRNAQNENHRQVELNYFLYLQPQLATPEIRMAYSFYSNAQALTGYSQKVNAFNNSLYALELFYGIQLLHIIYNGIAWENGLLIVDGGKDNTPAANSLHTSFIIAPEIRANGKQGTTAQIGLTYYF